MAVRRLNPDQPATFAFTPENLAWAEETIAKYPPDRQASAVIPILWRAARPPRGGGVAPAPPPPDDALPVARSRQAPGRLPPPYPRRAAPYVGGWRLELGGGRMPRLLRQRPGR